MLPFARIGVVGGAMLALGRALGETMAVTFVIGNAHRISTSLFAPGTTISATIANEFTEATGELYTSLADRAGPDPVLHHLHRAGLRPADAAPARTTGRASDMPPSASASIVRRRVANGVFIVAVASRAAVFGLVWLAFILGALLDEGFAALSPHPLHRDRRRRPASQGGLLNAIVGSVMMSVLAVAGRHADRPAGRHLSGRICARHARFAFVVRFVNDILLSAPVHRHRPVHL